MDVALRRSGVPLYTIGLVHFPSLYPFPGPLPEANW
jgi:hypothetical protein